MNRWKVLCVLTLSCTGISSAIGTAAAQVKTYPIVDEVCVRNAIEQCIVRNTPDLEGLWDENGNQWTVAGKRLAPVNKEPPRFIPVPLANSPYATKTTVKTFITGAGIEVHLSVWDKDPVIRACRLGYVNISGDPRWIETVGAPRRGKIVHGRHNHRELDRQSFKP